MYLLHDFSQAHSNAYYAIRFTFWTNEKHPASISKSPSIPIAQSSFITPLWPALLFNYCLGPCQRHFKILRKSIGAVSNHVFCFSPNLRCTAGILKSSVIPFDLSTWMTPIFATLVSAFLLRHFERLFGHHCWSRNRCQSFHRNWLIAWKSRSLRICSFVLKFLLGQIPGLVVWPNSSRGYKTAMQLHHNQSSVFGAISKWP